MLNMVGELAQLSLPSDRTPQQLTCLPVCSKLALMFNTATVTFLHRRLCLRYIVAATFNGLHLSLGGGGGGGGGGSKIEKFKMDT